VGWLGEVVRAGIYAVPDVVLLVGVDRVVDSLFGVVKKSRAMLNEAEVAAAEAMQLSSLVTTFARRQRPEPGICFTPW
jgi:hypothetical protein